MANKRQVKQTLHWVERVKIWQLLVIFVLSLFVTATFLRLNNIGMVERREAVIAADKIGDTGEMQQRLYDLQRYSATHMNASSGDIYLEKEYKRDVQLLVEAAKQQNSGDDFNVLKKADDVCKPRFSGYTQAYVQCVAAEQAKYPSSSGPQTVEFPDPSLYKHSYVSPLWSPDFAGWSLLASGFLLLLIVVRITIYTILRIMLKRNYRNV